MESESSIANKVSDSGYSNSYSNSHSCSPSQTSRSASSKSKHSDSNSSRSSGYCGAASATQDNSSSTAGEGLPPPKRYKSKEYKNKKLKSRNALNAATNVAHSAAAAFANDPIDITQLSIVEQQSQNQDKVVLDDVSAVTDSDVSTLPTTNESETLMQNTKELEVNEFSAEESNIEPLVTAEDLSLDQDNQLTAFSKDNHIEAERKDEEDILKERTVHGTEVGFCCVISMFDGIVLYTTPSLTTVLGFPKDMWLGRSFIDFIHPKDRETFSTQVTTGIAVPLMESQEKCEDVKTYLYVCLRKYKGLKSSGFGVVEKAVPYQAFHLTITMKYIPAPIDSAAPESNAGKFLVVVAVPVQSSYKVPRERKDSTKFGMRHTTGCILNHVDPDVVANFGFLPQDMLGKSVFDFYHPEDMPILKEVYKSVMKMSQIDGSVFRSKPYRFLVQNGCFAVIETEWSSFFNPWSKRLEFIISLHRVLEGPMNPDVFAVTSDKEFKNIPKETIRAGKNLQAEVIQILNENLPRSTESVTQEVSKRCKGLAGFMESLMNGVSQPNLQLQLPKEPDVCISDRDSVMLGEISPHDDYYYSKSSSETPPSYNQLNYNENIKRFFQSKPITTASDEINGVQNNEISDQEAKKCLSSENSGASGSGSREMLSSGSNQNMDSSTTSGTNTSNESYKRPPLTESILVKHNEDMEKLMAKKHKELRHNNDKDRYHKRGQYKVDKNRDENFNNNEQPHGLKRSGSTTRLEGDFHKVSKYQHAQSADLVHRSETNRNGNNILSAFQPLEPNNNVQYPGFGSRGLTNYPPNITDVNLWPPFSAPQGIPETSTAGSSTYPSTPMLPVYYIPTVPQRGNFMEPIPRYPVQYMPSVFYNHVFPSSPILCSPVPVMSLAPNPTNSVAPPDVRHLNTMAYLKINTDAVNGTNESGPDITMQNDRFGPMPNPVPQKPNDRPPSTATSVKAELGSKMGSIASASVVKKALSESSTKEMQTHSVCSPDFPLVSPSDGETQHFNAKTNDIPTTGAGATKKAASMFRGITIDESSSCYSSSYSSFLKTDSGSRSNDDSNYNKTNQTDDEIGDWRHKKTQPMTRKKDPQWLESVAMSSDLIYRYQVAVQNIEEILESDLKKLKEVEQPVMVNDQLNQLYIEMELEGLSKALNLEEGLSSSSSSGEDVNPQPPTTSKLKKKRRSYGSLMMIYEEDAPFPPPELNQKQAS